MKILVDKQTPCELQYVGLPIIDHEVCKKTETGKTFLRSTNKELPDVQLCAGHLEGGKDACQVSFGKRIVVHKLQITYFQNGHFFSKHREIQVDPWLPVLQMEQFNWLES